MNPIHLCPPDPAPLAAAMMAIADFPRLVQTVQRNCHIADSRHAREATLCNYLLEMREFFRWEHEVPLARALPRQELGSWISEREALWDGLQADALEPLLGAAWPDLIASLKGRRAEILARAVRDNLADCLSTLPRLIERDAACSIHFYFANFDGIRASLFPLLDGAYRGWRESGSRDALRKAAEAGSAHWHEAAQRLLRVHQREPDAAEETVAAWIEDPGALAL